MKTKNQKGFLIRVAQNSTFIFISKSIEMGAGLGIIAIVARHLGLEKMGTYLLAMAIGSFLQTAVSFGLISLTIREIAKQLEKAGEIMASILKLQTIIILSFLIPLTGICLLIRRKDPLLAGCLFLSFLYQAVGLGYDLLATAAFQAFEAMHWQIMVDTIHQLLAVMSVLYVVYVLKAGPVAIYGAFVCTSFISLIVTYSLIHKKLFKIKFFSPNSDQNWRWFLAETRSIAVNDILRQGNLRIGMLMLELFSNRVQVALFTAPQRILLRIRVCITMLVHPMLPEFSRQAVNNREKLAFYFEHSLRWFLIIGIASTILLFSSGNWLMILVLGKKYAPSGPCFAILSLFIPFLFFDYLCLNLLIACGQQHLAMKNILIGFSAHVLLSLFIVPKWHAIGASLIFVISIMVTSTFEYLSLRRIIPVKGCLLKQWPVLVAAAAAMSLFKIWPYQQKILLTSLILGVYWVILLLLGYFTAEDMAVIKKIGRRIYLKIAFLW